MAEIYKIEGIVLAAYAVGEVDRIYLIFSREYGKLRIIGKGTRKITAKLASGLEPLTFSEFFLVQGRQLDRIKGVIIIDQFQEIRKNLEKLEQALRVLNLLTIALPEREPSQALYQQLFQYLEQLKKIKPYRARQLEILRLAQAWKIIRQTGFQPEVFICCSCGKKIQLGDRFVLKIPDGLFCSHCAAADSKGQQLKVSVNLVKIIRIFLEKDLKVSLKLVLTTKELHELKRVTNHFLKSNFGIKTEI